MMICNGATYQAARQGNRLRRFSDAASVMPEGVAEVKGDALPIVGGRYRITFISHTFKYSFTALDE